MFFNNNLHQYSRANLTEKTLRIRLGSDVSTHCT